MKLFKIIIISFSVFLANYSYSQVEKINDIDKKLIQIFRVLVASGNESYHDSLSQQFKNNLLNYLYLQLTFDNSLDSISKYITVKSSQDNEIKFYSWDEQFISPWHTINCYAQFKASDGKILVQSISGDSDEVDFTDSKIYKVYDLSIDSTKCYLTFAWGTHGGGHQHQIIQVFKRVSDSLITCESCLNNCKDIVIEYPRSAKADINFNPLTQEISYNDFKLNEDSGFYEPTGKQVILKLKNGTFVIK